MIIKRKIYSKQFKIDAVKPITEQNYKISETARNLEINPNVPRRWKDQFATDSNQKSLLYEGRNTPFCVVVAAQTSSIMFGGNVRHVEEPDAEKLRYPALLHYGVRVILSWLLATRYIQGGRYRWYSLFRSLLR